jgi:HSP20 family protein
MANIVRRREPWVPDLRREIDQLFDQFFSPGSLSAAGGEGFVPKLELQESADNYLIRAELPGLGAEDIELNVDNDVLSLRGEKRQGEEKNFRGFHYSERSYGSFTRAIQLPPGVDASKIDASFKNGVLEVKIPKSERAKPQKIAVSSGEEGKKIGAKGAEAGGEKPPAK